MLDAETRDYIETSRDRRQIEVSVQKLPAKGAPSGPGAAEAEALAWERLQAQVAQAIAAYADQGLRLIRNYKARRMLVFTGPAKAWRAFLADHRALTADATLEFRRHHYDWREGLGGLPPVWD